MKSYFYGSTKELHNVVQEPQSIQFHKTRYVYFPKVINPSIQHRIGKQLEDAMADGQIQVFLQPRMDLQRGSICAAEALARWQWPDGRWSLPQHFLPALQQTGMMSVFDFYMLNQVASLQRCWLQQQKAPFSVSVNISADALLQPHAVERILECVQHHGLQAGQLELELTEHCMMEQQQALVPVLKTLREAGLTISMDDFGIGSSSLSMLLQLPVDVVKLDKSFLEADITDKKVYNYIMQVINLLRSAGTKIVCEGIETSEQASILADLAVEEGQGWYWERPLHWRMFMQKYILDKDKKNCYYI